YGIAAIAAGIMFVIAVFGCILLHELGHALMARRFGVGTRDITLLPIGGVARLERMPKRPSQEVAVALAGPAVNVVIAVLLFGLLLISGGNWQVFAAGVTEDSLLVALIWVNLLLVAFNLLPAFPMDGGRVFRALLATRLSYLRATEIASGIGQAMAIVFGMIGLYQGGMLIVLAVFVFLAARAELAAVRAQTLAESRLQPSTADVLPSAGPRYLPAETRVEDAAKIVLFSPLFHFPVGYRTDVVGLFTRSDLLRALSAGYGQRPVADVLQQ
ncbi:MAG: site-2 protease family protein, partial [Planctomycetales bacterium]